MAARGRKPKPLPPYEVRELADATWPCIEIGRPGFSPIVVLPLPAFAPAREDVLPARRELAHRIVELLNDKA